jgi:hypothetical protein
MSWLGELRKAQAEMAARRNVDPWRLRLERMWHLKRSRGTVRGCVLFEAVM